jgi:hypothetical protein
MAKRFCLSLVFLLLVALIYCGLALAASPEFSADMIMTDAKGKVTTGKIYIQGNEKIRQEISDNNEVSVTILRIDKKVCWTLMPENQYMEIKFPFDPNQPNPDFEYEMKTIGRETVNGYSCQVIQYTYKDKKYGILVQWVSDELGFAVKAETKTTKGKVNSTVEYKNIVKGKQPDELFEIPAGYEKFSLIPKLPF